MSVGEREGRREEWLKRSRSEGGRMEGLRYKL